MPYINISTSEKVDNKKKLLEEITTLISTLTKKSKKHTKKSIFFNFLVI